MENVNLVLCCCSPCFGTLNYQSLYGSIVQSINSPLYQSTYQFIILSIIPRIHLSLNVSSANIGATLLYFCDERMAPS